VIPNVKDLNHVPTAIMIAASVKNVEMGLSMGLKNVIVIQNKVDLVDEERALKNFKQIKDFLAETIYKDAPIIPTSAVHNINVDKIIEAIETLVTTPKRDDTKEPLMLVARSFDINKPGTPVDNILGGVLGGSIMQGKLQVGQEIEIKPGYEVEEKNQKIWKVSALPRNLSARQENILKRKK